MNVETSKTEPPHPRSNSALSSTFGLKSMFYATTLLASGMAIWGTDSILFSIFVLIFWAVQFIIAEAQFKNAIPTSLFILFVLAILFYLIVPTVGIPRGYPRGTKCKNDMRQFVLAMRVYESEFGQLPDAIKTVNGNPHSWRTTILPYMEQQNQFDLYDYSLPWDSKTNMWLDFSSHLTSPTREDHGGKTTFKLVVGEGTVLQSDRTPAIDSITDGAANTILLIEDLADPVFFTQPKDIDIEEAVTKLSGLTIEDAVYSYEDTFATSYFGPTFVCSDGSAHHLGFGVEPETLRRAFLCADGEPVDIAQLCKPHRVVNYAAIFAMASSVVAATIYIGLILLPIWTYRRNLRERSSGNPKRQRGVG